MKRVAYLVFREAYFVREEMKEERRGMRGWEWQE